MAKKRKTPAAAPAPVPRNRIKRHVVIRSGDLVPHEANPRTHPEHQKAALLGLYGEVGFARSLLAYELPDGRLKLIDGHMRQSLNPDMEVTVEVLDLTEDEAKKLLLTLDPIGAMAANDKDKLDALMREVETGSEGLADLLTHLAVTSGIVPPEEPAAPGEPEKDRYKEQYAVIVTCRDEEHQRELYEALKAEGHDVKVVVT